MITENSKLTLNYQLYFPLAMAESAADLIFPCPHCKANLQIKPQDNVPSKALSCPTCNGEFNLAGCGKCKAVFSLRSNMREGLSHTASTICPACSAELICFLWPGNYSSTFKIEDTDGYELVLPQRDKNQQFVVSEGSALVFYCFGCKAELHKVGILHEYVYCERCRECNYLIACPHCAQLFPVRCEMKDALNTVINCPVCKVYLTWPALFIELSGTHTRSLLAWSDEVREEKYIQRFSAVLSDPVKQRLAVYHATTGARVSGAEYHLRQLKNIRLKSLRPSSNDAAASNLFDVNEAEFSQEILLDVYTFGFVNSLRSSLDILVQELAVLFALPLSENNIDFGLKKLRGKFPTVIEDQLLAFLNSDDYLYLKELRNTVQHRRIWLEGTRSFFNIHPVTGGEEPIEVKILLPDQPSALPGTQTYVQNKELILTFSSLSMKIKRFIFNIYELAAQI